MDFFSEYAKWLIPKDRKPSLGFASLQSIGKAHQIGHRPCADLPQPTDDMRHHLLFPRG